MYDRNEVEALLVAMWNYGVLADDLAPDEGMPRAKANPSHLGNLVVAMIDISRAWDTIILTFSARQALCLRYGQGYTLPEVAHVQGVAHQVAQRRIDRSVSAMQAQINGREFDDNYGEEE